MTQQQEILPTHFYPTHYEMLFYPQPEQNQFTSTVTIHFVCTTQTTELILNGNNFTNIKSELTNKTTKETVSLTSTEDKEKERYIFTGYSFEKGEYQIKLEFIGELRSDKLMGYYQSHYELDGVQKTICTTQFEPACARNAFLCFDEPIYKATFDISLKVPQHHQCFSNMPIKSTENVENNLKIVKFETTVKMSTYLVCFVDGEFESYYDETENGIKLSLNFPKNHKNVSRFALDVMKKCLTLYEKTYKIPYPLSKCDWVAVPDFDAGAMENWGLITSREIEVCLKENAAHTSFKRSASVVCHELAHMWFGDLVTMKWWNDLWLNEGFASYMGDLFGVNTLFPEWKMEDGNVYGSLLSALDMDGCASTHPISVPVYKASDIEQLFDLISYDKGSALINMMMNFVGFEKFYEGVNLYLKKYQYSNAVSDELWTMIGEHCGIDLKDIVQEWTYKAGFPLITMELKDNKLTISQERCGCESDQLWKVPMILSCGEYSQQFVLREKTETIEWKHPYVIGNTNAAGFYRTIYSKEMYEELQKQTIKQKELLMIVDDLYRAMTIGKVSTVDYLSFIKSLKPFTPDTYYLACLVSGHLGRIKSTFTNEIVEKYIEEEKVRLYNPSIETLGLKPIENEPIDNARMRSLALGIIEVNEIIEEAKKYIKEKRIGECPAEMRAMMIGKAGKYADQEIIDCLKELYFKGESVEIQRLAMRGIASINDKELFAQTIEFAQSVRQQDFWFISYVSTVNKHNTFAEWLKEHWNEVDEKFFSGTTCAARNYSIEGLCSRYSTMNEYNEMKKFFEDHPCPASQNSINTSLELLLKRAEWFERDVKEVLEYLK